MQTTKPIPRNPEKHSNIFDTKQDQAKESYQLWLAVSAAMGDLLVPRLNASRDQTRADRARTEDAKRRKHDEQFLIALDQFILAMQKPELILAVTGTTSSGKSTVVNFLCGSEIMPVAVGEKSAGVVTIKHSTHRRVVIQKTDGATWPTGEWPRSGQPELTDSAIRDLLNQAMNEYNKLRDTPGEPACPIIDVFYPTRLGTDPALLDLPAGCIFRILDLPGLKYVGDEGNSKVIRQSSREALCLVLYDSMEVDPGKKRILLEQVADQVKALGGTPARMLFVLNRIDAFGKNLDGHIEEEEFVKKTELAIRQVLLDKLGEHAAYIRNIKPVKLSSHPGFLALLARSHSGNEQTQALKGIDDHYRRLIPNDVRDHLLGNIRMWQPAQVRAVTEAVLRTSHCLAFEDRLRSHIRERLPELVIPQAVERFRGEAAFDAAKWADLLTQAELNSSEERYKRECDRIIDARSGLSQLRDESFRVLCAPFEQIRLAIDKSPIQNQADIDRVMNEWRDSVKVMEEKPPYDHLPGGLVPLYSWREDLAFVVEKALTCIQDAMLEGRSIVQTNAPTVIDQLSSDNRKSLAAACDALRQAGYTKQLAKEGGRRTAASEIERQELQKINGALKNLSKSLKPALEDLVYRARQSELDRVYEALLRLFERHRQHVEKSAKELVRKLELELIPEMPLVALGRVQAELEKSSYDLNTSLDIVRHKDQVQVGVIKEKIGSRNETWREAVQSQTSPGIGGWLLGKLMGTVRWIQKSRSVPIFDERPRYEFREYDETSIPPIADLVQSWKDGTRQKDPEMLREIGAWLLQQAGEVSKSIDVFQTKLLESYQGELDAAHAGAKETTDNEKQCWSDVHEKLKKFRDSIERLASLSAQV